MNRKRRKMNKKRRKMNKKRRKVNKKKKRKKNKKNRRNEQEAFKAFKVRFSKSYVQRPKRTCCFLSILQEVWHQPAMICVDFWEYRQIQIRYWEFNPTILHSSNSFLVLGGVKSSRGPVCSPEWRWVSEKVKLFVWTKYGYFLFFFLSG